MIKYQSVNERFFTVLYPVLMVLLLGSPIGMAQTIVIHTLKTQPKMDGNNSDWSAIPAVKVALRKTSSNTYEHVDHVLVKAGRHAGNIYFFLEWEDTTHSKIHKPWVWDPQKSKYVKGPQREDRLAIQFAMRGDYTNNWLSGKSFKADMWHWKAARSNPLHLVHDKSTTISTNKVLRSAKFKSPSGQTVYIARPSDAGDKLYRTKRYRKYVGDIMPKYLLTNNPTGSVADIKGMGVWRDDRWYLEIQRKLNTQHDDDIVFPAPGGTVAGAIAVFNATDNEDHSISDILNFQF